VDRHEILYKTFAYEGRQVFESKKIRATWHEADQKWYFSVADVVKALTDGNDVKQYVKRMRGIAVRDELTGEWKKRGVKESRKFAVLTAQNFKELPEREVRRLNAGQEESSS
jgi:hypothetical protein